MTRLVATSTVPQGSYEDGLAWVGRTQGPVPCPTRVDAGHARLFAALVRDADPRWWRDGWDQGDVEVPPGLLLSYALPPPWHPDGAELRPIWTRVPLPGTTLINVSTRTEHPLPLHTGRRLTVRETVESISPLKRTRLGEGHFVTTVMEFEDDGALVARHENVMLRYALDDRAAELEAAPSGPAPAAHRATWTTSATIPVTLEECVLNVAATQDLFPGHYDRDYARAQRVSGVFLNTMFFQGLVDRLALEAGGAGRRVLRRDLRMRGSATDGDTVEAGAGVPTRRDGETMVDVDVTASGRVAAQALVVLSARSDDGGGA